MAEIITESHGILPDGARYVREIVFVEEQGFEEEFDTVDTCAYHALMTEDDEPIGTGRVFIEQGDTWHIGRLAVRKEYRSGGRGARILAYLERIAKREGASCTILGAQYRAREFYMKQGYTIYGDLFYEEDCPHIMMRKQLD